jgi:spore maturation protein SpmB
MIVTYSYSGAGRPENASLTALHSAIALAAGRLLTTTTVIVHSADSTKHTVAITADHETSVTPEYVAMIGQTFGAQVVEVAAAPPTPEAAAPSAPLPSSPPPARRPRVRKPKS